MISFVVTMALAQFGILMSRAECISSSKQLAVASFTTVTFVPNLSGITNSCLHARVCYEPDDDELMDAMRFDLQIQIHVGKAAGTPMLEGHDIAWLRLEFAADLAPPRVVFEDLSQPRYLLDGRPRLPSLVVVWTVATMQRIEDAKLRLSRSIQDLLHMRKAIVCFRNGLQAIPYFASLGNDIVGRIDHKKCNELLVLCYLCHVSFQRSYARGIRSPSDQTASGKAIYTS